MRFISVEGQSEAGQPLCSWEEGLPRTMGPAWGGGREACQAGRAPPRSLAWFPPRTGEVNTFLGQLCSHPHPPAPDAPPAVELLEGRTQRVCMTHSESEWYMVAGTLCQAAS